MIYGLFPELLAMLTALPREFKDTGLPPRAMQKGPESHSFLCTAWQCFTRFTRPATLSFVPASLLLLACSITDLRLRGFVGMTCPLRARLFLTASGEPAIAKIGLAADILVLEYGLEGWEDLSWSSWGEDRSCFKALMVLRVPRLRTILARQSNPWSKSENFWLEDWDDNFPSSLENNRLNMLPLTTLGSISSNGARMVPQLAFLESWEWYLITYLTFKWPRLKLEAGILS